jgi:hypothetical protein
VAFVQLGIILELMRRSDIGYDKQHDQRNGTKRGVFHVSFLNFEKKQCCRLAKRPPSDSLAELLIGRVRSS